MKKQLEQFILHTIFTRMKDPMVYNIIINNMDCSIHITKTCNFQSINIDIVLERYGRAKMVGLWLKDKSSIAECITKAMDLFGETKCNSLMQKKHVFVSTYHPDVYESYLKTATGDISSQF